MLLKLLMEAFQFAVSSDSSDDNRTSFMDAVRTLKSLGSTLNAQAGLYVQLAELEWKQEKERLLKMCVALVIALFSFLCAMLFLGILIMAIVWDTEYRIPVIAGLIGVYLLGIALAVWRFKVLALQGERAFASIKEELAADIALIKREL